MPMMDFDLWFSPEGSNLDELQYYGVSCNRDVYSRIVDIHRKQKKVTS